MKSALCLVLILAAASASNFEDIIKSDSCAEKSVEVLRVEIDQKVIELKAVV